MARRIECGDTSDHAAGLERMRGYIERIAWNYERLRITIERVTLHIERSRDGIERIM